MCTASDLTGNTIPRANTTVMVTSYYIVLRRVIVTDQTVTRGMADDLGLCLGRSRYIASHLKAMTSWVIYPERQSPRTGLDLVGGNVADVLAARQKYSYEQYWG